MRASPGPRAMLLAVVLAAAGCARDLSHGMALTSTAFATGGAIPKRYSCDGENVSPPLAWTGAPAAAKSFALVCDDPDARDFTHWVVFNLPPDAASVAEGAGASHLPEGAGQGANDFGGVGYGGPCPPTGEHRYVFHLYALDAPLSAATFTKNQLESAMKGHVLAEARLTGTYRRGAP